MTKTNTNGEPVSQSTVDFTLDELKTYLNGEFRDSINTDIDQKLSGLSDRVKMNQDEIKTHKEEMKKEMKKMREELNASKAPPSIVSYAHAAKNVGLRPRPSGRADHEEAQ